MGLDNYAVILTENDRDHYEMAPDEDFQGIRLCGGVFSGGSGSSSFRGKVYNAFIEKVTHEKYSLYMPFIGPLGIAEIAEALEVFDFHGDVIIFGDFRVTRDEWANLVKFFGVCRDKGHALVSWC